MKSQASTKIIDEFAFVLLAALVFIGIMLVFWTTPQELPPSLEPRTISVKMLPNSQKMITFKIKGNLTSVNLIANDTLSNIVSFSENNFNVYGEKEVKVTLTAPSTYGRYTGCIIARGKGGEDTIEVKIDVVPTLTLTSRSLRIPDFKVSYYGEEKVVDRRSNFTVEKSLLSSKSAKIIFIPERNEIEEAKLKLFIYDSHGSGSLVVKLNRKTIFKERLSDLNFFIEIPLNISDIKEENLISIEVENEGFGILFGASCDISNAEVRVKYKSIPYSFELPLSQSEIDNFYAIEISSFLVSDSQLPPSIEIKINNQKVFIGKPSKELKLNITKDLMGNNLLLSQSNNVSISLITEGEISFTNNIMRIYSYST
jgi:hypothetical protein